MADTACTLGCCVNTAAVWDRCERRKVLDLDDVTCVSWGRELDDLSEASVTVGMSGACCDLLDGIRSWRHQLVVSRCGRQVWSGPILRNTYGRDESVIEAVDPGVWLDRRLIRTDREVCGSLTDIARELITEALAHPDGAADDTCITVDYRECGHSGCRKYESCRSTAAAELRGLARGPLNFTAVGRRLVVWCGGTIGRTNILQDKDFIGELSVVEDGYPLATAVCVVGKGVQAYCGGADPYYGLVEITIKDDAIITEADAMALACQEVAARSRPPLILSVPDGIQLDPRAPVTIEQLVPGVLIPVWSDSTCRKVSEEMVLTRVRVTQGCSGDSGEETVAITVAPKASIGEVAA